MVMRRLRKTWARIFPVTDRREMPRQLPQSVLLPLFLNRDTNVTFLNSFGTSSSSQMLVRSEWSASRATGPANLKISAGIPSIPGDFPSWSVWIWSPSKLHQSLGGGRGWCSRASVGSGRAQWDPQWRVCWTRYWSVPFTLRRCCSSP